MVALALVSALVAMALLAQRRRSAFVAWAGHFRTRRYVARVVRLRGRDPVKPRVPLVVGVVHGRRPRSPILIGGGERQVQVGVADGLGDGPEIGMLSAIYVLLPC